jgi:hypothetical protein
MNKNNLILLISSLFLLSNLAQAEDGNWYIGGFYSEVSYDDHLESWTHPNNPTTYWVSDPEGEVDSYGVIVGYDFKAVEGLDLAIEFGGRVIEASDDPDEAVTNIVPFVTMDEDAYIFSAQGIFGKSWGFWGIFLKGGFGLDEQERFSGDQFFAMYGAGVRFDFGPVRLRLEYDVLEAGSQEDGPLYSKHDYTGIGATLLFNF